MRRKSKQFIAMLLVVCLSFISTNAQVLAKEGIEPLQTIEGAVSGNATAAEKENPKWDGVTTSNVYEGEGYKVTYTLTDHWQGGYNASVNIENTGAATIENWILCFDYPGVISKVWNATISSHEGTRYVLKNAEWNQDIATSKSISFGISGAQDFQGFPEYYELQGEIADVESDAYQINYKLGNDWGSGFTSQISITNQSAETLEDWVLEFDYNRTITNIWNGVIVSHEGNHYVIKNAGYNSNIAPNKSVTFGFNGTDGAKSDEPSNYKLCSYTDSVVDKPVQEWVLSANTQDLFYNESLDLYTVDQPMKTLSGIISDSKRVKKLSYKVEDIKGTLVKSGSIPIQNNWVIDPFGLAIGYNKLTLTATLKGNQKVETNIQFMNYDATNMKQTNVDLTDTDGDELNNYFESVLGSDKLKVDTDGDSLSDFDEFTKVGTDPTKQDTDANGVWDGLEDMDQDGLITIDELKYGSSLFGADTDRDELNDGDEVQIYGTSPINRDTDNDGVIDGREIEIGSNPLIAENLFAVTAKANSVDKVKVSVLTELTGSQVDSLSVTRFDNEFLFPETMPGYIGGAYEFKVDGVFNKAEIKFEFDYELLKKTDFDPTIYYFNEDTQLLEPLETTISGNCASTTTTHFSKYILINRTVYDESFEWEDVWNTSGFENVEVVLVIDDSDSMRWNDYSNERLVVAKSLVDNLPKNSAVGVVRFNSSSTKVSSITTNKTLVKSRLSTSYFKSIGGTSMYTAINSTFPMFSSTDDTTLKMMIVLSDGETSDKDLHSSVVSTANQNGVKIFTVGLGSSKTYFESYLKPLANNTGAIFYSASDSSKLAEIYDDINKKIDIETDSDGDGITDYYEDNIVMFNGMKISTNKSNADTDGDGLLDGEETTKLNYKYNYDKSQVIVTGKLISNPLKKDTDGDGIEDFEDPEPYKHFGTYIKNNIDFRLAKSTEIETPFNSAIETSKKVTLEDYQRIFDERKPLLLTLPPKDEAGYIIGIQNRVALLLSASYAANGMIQMTGKLCDQKIDINAGCYFLTYYLSTNGGYVEYDGTYPAVEDPNGLAMYNVYVNKLLDVCESGTKKGNKLNFTQIDAACGDTSIAYSHDKYSLSTLNYFLAVKGGHIGMAGKCVYDGEYYYLSLHYYVQDYYDFYYEDPIDGKDCIGPVSNNEMAYLKLYGAAENFENCGVYKVMIKWKKGQSLNEAIQLSMN